MTRLELFHWLCDQEELLDMRPLPEVGIAELLRREALARPRVDDWIQQAYLEDRAPLLDEELRQWVGLRLMAAVCHLRPRLAGRWGQATIDPPTELRQLLLVDWPVLGVPQLAAQVRGLASIAP